MSVHFQCSGLRSSCIECRMGEQVLLPTVSSDPCSSQGLEGRGAQAFSPESESPVPPPESHCPGAHQLNIAGQTLRCTCSCGAFLNASHSQTTPSTGSSKQTQRPEDRSPKAKARSWEAFWVLLTLPREPSSV